MAMYRHFTAYSTLHEVCFEYAGVCPVTGCRQKVVTVTTCFDCGARGQLSRTIYDMDQPDDRIMERIMATAEGVC